MFYLAYLRSELVRRKARTILTMLGLAVGVALVIAISALARGLDRAQKTALDPLSSIGTDLTVTLAPQQDSGGGFGFGGGNRQLLEANRSAITDLSKLGKPGTHFVHDFFLPGTQLTFPQQQAGQIAALPGVAAVASGLLLSAVHQEGTVPKIVASIRTGGDRLRVTGRIARPSAAEFAQMQACFAKAGVGQPARQRGQGRGGQGGGGLGGGGLGGGGGGRRGGFFDSAAARKCLPARFRRFRTSVTTPEKTLKQIVAPPQTDISSASYSIGGVDPSQPGIGLVTPSLVSSGRFIAKAGGREALLAAGYAARQKLKVGSKLDLNGTVFRVVGLVRPPVGGQTADVYVPLARLQKLSGQTAAANVVLVRARDGSSVDAVQKEIERRYPNAQVASAKQVADTIGGSLVDASNLSHRLGVALAALVAAAAFLLAALLTLSSVGKRVRELGTLKALGWTQFQVVRQVVGESLAQGLAGGLLGVGLGVAIAAAIEAFGPTLTASSSTGGGADAFGLGALTARTVSDRIALTAPIAVPILLIGLALAIAGGLIAGAAGALRASRLRPADALRTVE
jgi:ABC-type antimicrobial peptide transport system permease subunit